MSPGTVVTTSMDRLGRSPIRSDLQHRRPAVAHLQLYLRRDRDRAAGVLDQLPFLVAEVAAVDVGRVGPEQPVVVQLLDHGEPAGEPAHRDVHRDRDAQLPGEFPLRLNDLVHAEAACRGWPGL